MIKFKELHKEDEDEDEAAAFWGYNEYVLHVLRDGVKRTAKDIYEEISTMPKYPWGPETRTPWASVQAVCGTLARSGKIQKITDNPYKYYTDNNIE